jgi:FMN reductase
MDYGVVNLVGLGGSFKNTLDWLQLLSDRDPPYLGNKLVGLVSTAGGVRGLQAVNTMEFVVRALRGWAVPLVIPGPRRGRPSTARGESSIWVWANSSGSWARK